MKDDIQPGLQRNSAMTMLRVLRVQMPDATMLVNDMSFAQAEGGACRISCGLTVNVYGSNDFDRCIAGLFYFRN